MAEAIRCSCTAARRSCPKPVAMSSVCPGARPVTIPVGPTLAITVSCTCHWMPPCTARPFWEGITANSVSLSSGPTTTLVPDKAMLAGATSIGAVAMSPLAVVAWRMLRPGPTPTTRPAESTAADLGTQQLPGDPGGIHRCTVLALGLRGEGDAFPRQQGQGGWVEG